MSTKIQELVVISDPFDGSLISIVDINGIVVNSGGKTKHEFQEDSEKQIEFVSWYEYETMRLDYYCTDLEAIKKIEFDSSKKLNALKKMTIRNRFETFYGKALSDNIHEFFVLDTYHDLYYKGVKPMTLTVIEIYREIIKDVNKKIKHKNK